MDGVVFGKLKETKKNAGDNERARRAIEEED